MPMKKKSHPKTKAQDAETPRAKFLQIFPM
jgi:hypothetical protein